MSGFYLMHRDWQDNAVFGNEEYSSRDAWVWLVENAAWKPSRVRVKGEVVELGRGELCFAQRFMAEKWGWSKSRVDRFLKRLCAENMISIRSKTGATAGQGSGQGQSIITVCNYAEYQDLSDGQRGNEKRQTGATAGQQRGEEEQGNKGTIESSEAKASSPRARKADFVLPSNIPAEAWDGWLEMRKKIGKPPTDHAKTLAVAELDKLAADGWPPGDVLNHCTLNAYQGIFPPKDRKNANRNSSTTGNRSPDGWGTVLREVGGRETRNSPP